MKALRNLIILGLLGYLAWKYFVPQGTGERPALFMGNGPVHIEVVQDRRGRGEFTKGFFGTSGAFYHKHPGQAPSKFEVVVTDSSCGQEARYTATELRVLSNSGAGTSSNITISIGGFGPFAALEVDADTGTTIVQDPRLPYQLNIGTPDEQLTTVRVAGSNCAFTPGGGSITIYQKQ